MMEIMYNKSKFDDGGENFGSGTKEFLQSFI